VSEQGVQPRTWWSGDSSPEDTRNAQTGVLLTLLVILLVSPLAVIFAVACYLSFTRGRIRHGVIAQVTAVMTLIMTVTGLLFSSISNYASSIVDLVTSVTEKNFSVGVLISTLATQAPASILIGMWVGTAYCWWRWMRRSVWEEVDFRLTPYQVFMKRKHINDIKDDKHSPNNGATMGINAFGQKIIQTDQESAAHTFYVGASGSGKTTTMMTQVRDLIRREHGMIIIDLKGSQEVAEIAAEYAERYGRRFQHFTFQDPREKYTGPAPEGAPSFYDALGRGDSSRRKDMLIAGRQWSEDYYKIVVSSYLQTAFDVLIAVPPERPRDSLSDIIHLLNPANLATRALGLPDDEYYEEVKENVHNWCSRKLTAGESSAINGFVQELQLLRGSTAGRWLRRNDDPEKNIDIFRAAQRGDVIVFSLDSLTYTKTAPAIANLIIEDLKTVAAELLVNPAPKPVDVFLDEFSAIDSENIIGLINKTRSAKMAVRLSTQALGDLRRVNMTFLDQLLGIVNSFVIHRANTYDDAEVLAGLIGKDKQWNVRLGVEHTSGLFGSVGKGSATGSGMLDKVDDYIFAPAVIQRLQPGEAIYLTKSPKERIEKIMVIPERIDLTPSGTDITTHIMKNKDETVIKVINDPVSMVKTPENDASVPFIDEEPMQEIGEAVEPFVPTPTKRSQGVFEGRDLKAAVSGKTVPVTRPQPTSSRPKDTMPEKPRRDQRDSQLPAPAKRSPNASRLLPKPVAQQDSNSRLPAPKRLPSAPLPKKPIDSGKKPNSPEVKKDDWANERW
jgi:ABC-type oligopeptide transport system ATPase subunit